MKLLVCNKICSKIVIVISKHYHFHGLHVSSIIDSLNNKAHGTDV